MQEVIELLNKASEVLARCRENADEKWMVDHLALVHTEIDQAIAKLQELKTRFLKGLPKIDKLIEGQKAKLIAGS